MGFILLLFSICLLVALIAFVNKANDGNCAFLGFTVSVMISIVIMLLTLWNSYGNTVTMQERLVAIEQYSHTVKVYSKHGIAEFKTSDGREITDLKYQNYQNQIGRMLVDLRDEINKYNARLVGKNVMSKNWFWSWCIVPAPKDSVILEMSDYTN